jgi:hypothetical protein
MIPVVTLFIYHTGVLARVRVTVTVVAKRTEVATVDTASRRDRLTSSSPAIVNSPNTFCFTRGGRVVGRIHQSRALASDTVGPKRTKVTTVATSSRRERIIVVGVLVILIALFLFIGGIIVVVVFVFLSDHSFCDIKAEVRESPRECLAVIQLESCNTS